MNKFICLGKKSKSLNFSANLFYTLFLKSWTYTVTSVVSELLIKFYTIARMAHNRLVLC